MGCQHTIQIAGCQVTLFVFLPIFCHISDKSPLYAITQNLQAHGGAAVITMLST